MNNLVPIDQAKSMLSALALQRMQEGRALNNNFSEGIRDAFPMLSIKGKVFRARVSGEETAFIDPATKQPVPFLDVVLVNGSRTLSKAYYAKGFTEGDFDPPQCWSLDSFKPDASVANKMSVTCQSCPMNVFGSRITDSGKQAKACQDARRVAVVMPHQLTTAEQMLMLLRVPQSSLKNLKVYVNLLERNNIEPGNCITRLAFDYQEAFPKLMFNFVAPLPEDSFRKVLELADSSGVQAMLSAPDFDVAPSRAPEPNAAAGIAGMAPQAAPMLASALPSNPAPQSMFPPPTLAPVEEHLITLPDGRMFNPATQQFVEKPKPVETAEKVMNDLTLKSTIITLPDGKKYDTATGQYVVEAKKEPELDPGTIKLPDGKFFNPAFGYVTGPEKGAPPAGAAPVGVQPEKPKRTRTVKPKDEASVTAAASQPNGKAEMMLQPEEDEAEEQTEKAVDDPNAVGPAPSSLDALITKLVPTV
jgi:hypothetical protein